MNDTGQSARRILTGVAYGAAVVAPLLLLLDLSASFLRDWPLHVWAIDYYAAYFRAHGDLPGVINLPSAVGVALPVFYAWLLYPLLGILSAVAGTALALRLALLGLVAVQFYALISAGRKILGHRGYAYTVAVSVIWATYSLTNLYNRGALAEYFGTGFYATALAFAASAAATDPGASRRFHGWLAGVFLLLAIGAHPPTAALAAGFTVLLGAGLIAGWRHWSLKLAGGDRAVLAGGVLAGAIILAPWIYANVVLGGQLSITHAAGGFQFRPDQCDSFWGRFAPFPYDGTAVENGIYTLGTPYLEAPINIVLLGLLLWNLELGRRLYRRPGAGGSIISDSPVREVLIVGIGWFVFLTVLSLSPWLAGRCGAFAPYIQYVYRLVSHANAALLIAVFASGAAVARHGGYRQFQHQTEVVLAVGLTVAVLGLGIKLQHAAVAAVPDAGPPPSLVAGQREIAQAYDTPGRVRNLRDEEARTAVPVAFPVSRSGTDFGDAGALRIERAQAGWVKTNAVVFPWLRVESDGQAVSADQQAQTGHFLAVHLPAGIHELRAVWQPDRAWAVLNRLSQAVFALVLLVTVAWAAVRVWPRRGGVTPT